MNRKIEERKVLKLYWEKKKNIEAIDCIVTPSPTRKRNIYWIPIKMDGAGMIYLALSVLFKDSSGMKKFLYRSWYMQSH